MQRTKRTITRVRLFTSIEFIKALFFKTINIKLIYFKNIFFFACDSYISVSQITEVTPVKSYFDQFLC